MCKCFNANVQLFIQVCKLPTFLPQLLLLHTGNTTNRLTTGDNAARLTHYRLSISAYSFIFTPAAMTLYPNNGQHYFLAVAKLWLSIYSIFITSCDNKTAVGCLVWWFTIQLSWCLISFHFSTSQILHVKLTLRQLISAPFLILSAVGYTISFWVHVNVIHLSHSTLQVLNYSL